MAGVLASFALAGAQAASFECAKAKTEVEKLICSTPELSALDDKLGQIYRDVLAQATDKQKQRLSIEQKHWLKFARNVCQKVTCLKHAYWSRQAALETYFRPLPTLYAKESDKAGAVQQALAAATLYPSASNSAQPLCRPLFEALKQMRGIVFAEPVVQVLSYEDPALDPWKKQCRVAPPFHFSSWCEPKIESESADDDIASCHAGYGLPPFKLFELPPLKVGDHKRHIFYVEEGYGPMNDQRPPRMGGGGAGFKEIHTGKCLSIGGNYWEGWSGGDEDGTQLTDWDGVRATTGYGGTVGKNLNSLIQYQGKYYFLILRESDREYRLDVKSATPGETHVGCHWAPVKE